MHAGGFSELIGNEQIKEQFFTCDLFREGITLLCHKRRGWSWKDDGGEGICTDIGVSGRTCQQTVRRVPFMHTNF